MFAASGARVEEAAVFDAPCRVAHARLDVMEDGDLAASAVKRGRQLERLLDGRDTGRCRLALRGLGLLRALSFDGAPAGEAVLEQLAREAGLSVSANDDRSIGVSLPLISSDEEIRIVANRF